ncbi:Olfactory Receptor 8S1 [Manis pentadactyla]|nr:Olfactory Receptor 8S1 [Manis pentadactyla]
MAYDRYATICTLCSMTRQEQGLIHLLFHFIAVILFFGSGLISYLLPPSGSSLDLLSYLQYSVVTPMLNPLIYSLKNKEV